MSALEEAVVSRMIEKAVEIALAINVDQGGDPFSEDDMFVLRIGAAAGVQAGVAGLAAIL